MCFIVDNTDPQTGKPPRHNSAYGSTLLNKPMKYGKEKERKESFFFFLFFFSPSFAFTHALRLCVERGFTLWYSDSACKSFFLTRMHSVFCALRLWHNSPSKPPSNSNSAASFLFFFSFLLSYHWNTYQKTIYIFI